MVKENRDTTKTRIVYDASAKRRDNPSLNDCLESGPCQLPKIFNILVRFRAHRYALICGIKSAFLNIRINERDRNFLRFLWIQDIEKEDPEIVIKRFTSVVFGLTSSPFLLGATLNHHMRKYEDINPKFIDQFLNDLYMDDNITGFDDLIIGFDYYLYVKTLMKEGGFIVRKWLSNCQELSKKIKGYEQEYFNEDSVEEYNKVLGISWTAENDMLSFDLAQILRESLKAVVITKRNVLKTVSSIYDPLGLLSPAVVSLKMLFQEVCTHKIAWDKPLPTDFVNKWIRTLERLVGFKPVSINRHYLCGNEVKKCANL